MSDDITEEVLVPPPPPARRTSGVKILAGITVAGLAVLAASGGAIWYFVQRSQQAEVESGSYLSVRLSGSLTDAPVSGGLFDDPSDAAPTVTEIAAAIRLAATDERITGLLLRLDVPDAGWASWQELRGAVLELRAAGKPCVAYAESVMLNGDYYLASACDDVFIAPGGALLVNGLDMSLTYYKGTFEKLGVEPEYEHVGDFKSFIEVYERTGPSPSAAEAYNYLLDGTWNQLVAGIAAGRNKTPEEVKALIDRPTMSPKLAAERGLIDGVAWPDLVPKLLPKRGEEGWRASLAGPPSNEEADDDDHDTITPLREYLKELREQEPGSGKQVAVISAEGQIVSGGEGGGLFGDDGMLTDGKFSAWMEDAREDDDVAAVVVRVNSPGGSGLAAQQMWREVERMKAAGKPVVISMGDYAASGGYLMSCNADWIVAQPGTLTGSIGVFGGKFDLSGTYAKLGMTQHRFSRGAVSDLFSFSAPFSPEGRAVFREYLESFYKDFVQDVATGRKKSWDEIHAVAQGRVWTGEQALDRGLVDQLGGLPEAVAKAAELAELSDPGIVRLPKARSFMDLLMDDLASARVVQVELPFGTLLPDVQRELAVLEDIQRTGGIGAYLPGQLRLR